MDVKLGKKNSVWKRNLGSELDPRKKGTRGDLGKDMTLKELSYPNKGVCFFVLIFGTVDLLPLVGENNIFRFCPVGQNSHHCGLQAQSTV